MQSRFVFRFRCLRVRILIFSLNGSELRTAIILLAQFFKGLGPSEAHMWLSCPWILVLLGVVSALGMGQLLLNERLCIIDGLISVLRRKRSAFNHWCRMLPSTLKRFRNKLGVPVRLLHHLLILVLIVVLSLLLSHLLLVLLLLIGDLSLMLLGLHGMLSLVLLLLVGMLLTFSLVLLSMLFFFDSQLGILSFELGLKGILSKSHYLVHAWVSGGHVRIIPWECP